MVRWPHRHEWRVVPWDGSVDERTARQIAEERTQQQKEQNVGKQQKMQLDNIFSQLDDQEQVELRLLIKADVQGSVEALSDTLEGLSGEKAAVQVIHGMVGGINESDIQLANASGALVVGFNVRANKQARNLAELEKTEIRYYSVIYELADDMKGVLIGLMTPEIRESFLGNAEIREVFSVSKIGKVAGCYVSEGTVKRGAGVRLIRDDVVLHEGNLSTLKRFKDDVREVQQNYECGMSFENYNDIKAGDVIECFTLEEVAPEI